MVENINQNIIGFMKCKYLKIFNELSFRLVGSQFRQLLKLVQAHQRLVQLDHVFLLNALKPLCIQLHPKILSNPPKVLREDLLLLKCRKWRLNRNPHHFQVSNQNKLKCQEVFHHQLAQEETTPHL